MRTIYRLNGKMVDVDKQHIPPMVIGDCAYPVLRPFMDKLGIVTAVVDDYPDLRLFDCTEDEAGNLTITPKSDEVVAEQDRQERNRLILVQIESLENAITERRKRDAILLVDGAMEWLSAQDAKIAELRKSLEK